MSDTIKYVFRMTHLLNVPHIMQEGFVHSDSPRASECYIEIGDKSLIETRKNKYLKGHSINDYIPFYFGYRSPMLYVIQHGFNGVVMRKPQEIVYCALRIDDVISSGLRFIFTDGHANDSFTNVYDSDRIKDIDQIIQANDIYAKYWKSDDDTDLKRRKDAEFLILDEIPASLIAYYIVYNQDAKQQLEDMGVASEMIIIKPGYYY